MFLLTDSQIKEESFLEDVDSLLNTGEVPNLFAVDEKAELIEVSETFLNALPEKCAYSEVRIFPYSVQMQENTDQNNSEYGQFLRGDAYCHMVQLAHFRCSSTKLGL